MRSRGVTLLRARKTYPSTHQHVSNKSSRIEKWKTACLVRSSYRQPNSSKHVQQIVSLRRMAKVMLHRLASHRYQKRASRIWIQLTLPRIIEQPLSLSNCWPPGLIKVCSTHQTLRRTTNWNFSSCRRWRPFCPNQRSRIKRAAAGAQRLASRA